MWSDWTGLWTTVYFAAMFIAGGILSDRARLGWFGLPIALVFGPIGLVFLWVWPRRGRRARAA